MLKGFVKNVRRFWFSELLREHQRDRDHAYFLSLPNSTIRITHRGHTIRFYIPDADRDTVQRRILETRSFYEAAILARLRELVPMNGRVVADVGANIGNHTVYFTVVGGARLCHAFEPNPYARSVLERNVALNTLDDRVRVHPVGIAARAGNHSFDLIKAANIGSNSFKEGGEDNIAFAPLDSFNFDELALLKIDVEGMAKEALEGAEKVIKEFRPAIFIELIGSEKTRAMPVLRGLGYDIVEAMPGSNFLLRHRGG